MSDRCPLIVAFDEIKAYQGAYDASENTSVFTASEYTSAGVVVGGVDISLNDVMIAKTMRIMEVGRKNLQNEEVKPLSVDEIIKKYKVFRHLQEYCRSIYDLVQEYEYYVSMVATVHATSSTIFEYNVVCPDNDTTMVEMDEFMKKTLEYINLQTGSSIQLEVLAHPNSASNTNSTLLTDGENAAFTLLEQFEQNSVIYYNVLSEITNTIERELSVKSK